MKFLQNKIIIGAGCIVVAAVFSFMVLPRMYKDKGGTERIIKAGTTIAAGTKIEESMLTEAEAGSFGLPESVIREVSDAVGKYAKTEIMPDDLILKSKLSDYAADERLDAIFRNGQKLITVSLPSIAAGVGNHLQSGDIVSIICYIDDEPVIQDELQNLEVYSIENDDAENVEEMSPVEDEEQDRIAATLTLIVDEAQAEKLVAAEYSGKLHAVLERRGGENGE